MAKILVTGGSGLIGTAIVRKLLAESHMIHLLDLQNVTFKDNRLLFFQGSVLDTGAIERAINGCEYVVHLAAFMGVKSSLENPISCLDVNILGTRNILNASVAHKIKRVLFSSSSEVYGDSRVVPTHEGVDLLPKSEYGVAKVMCEEYLKSFKKEKGLDYAVVRFFSVYGETQRPEFVVSRFVHQAINGEKITVYGEGSQVRAFCYVGDAADGVVKALFSPHASGQVFNIGNDSTPITMLDLAQQVISLANSGKVEKIPMTHSDRTAEREIYRRIPDISKAKNVLGYTPTTSLNEGIQKVIDYVRTHTRA